MRVSRLPFSSIGAGGSAGASAPGGAPAISVSQAAALIDGVIRTGIPGAVRIAGEVTNFTERTHWYFSIKDAQSVLSCIMFAGKAKGAGFTPRSGQQVIVTARAEFYKPQGRVTLNVDRLEAVGQGALEQMLRERVEEARALGWLDADRKRALPKFPRRVAVITSRTGAALQDVINTARRRCPAVELMLIDTLVQGAGAAPGVSAAVRWVSGAARGLGIEALIVTRGGGSLEDLWAFNEREVAEAIVGCSVPVVAAIGHETDTTLAELVADERCATPTQAAMRLTPDRESLCEQSELVGARLRTAVEERVRGARKWWQGEVRHLALQARQRTASAARRVEALGARLERSRPAAVYERRCARLEEATRRLRDAVAARVRGADLEGAGKRLGLAGLRLIERARQRAAGLERQLELVGPQGVLARGFSVTLKAGGGVLREPGEVKAGDELVTRLADGSVRSTVSGSADDALAAQRRIGKPRKARASDPNQMGLF